MVDENMIRGCWVGFEFPSVFNYEIFVETEMETMVDCSIRINSLEEAYTHICGMILGCLSIDVLKSICRGEDQKIRFISFEDDGNSIRIDPKLKYHTNRYSNYLDDGNRAEGKKEIYLGIRKPIFLRRCESTEVFESRMKKLADRFHILIRFYEYTEGGYYGSNNWKYLYSYGRESYSKNEYHDLHQALLDDFCTESVSHHTYD